MSDVAVRASDAEREQAIARLRDHAVAGRLTLEELAARVDGVYEAQTRAELEGVLHDLPAEVVQSRKSPKRLTIAVFGGTERRGRWRVPAQAWAIAIFGGTTLDLRHAELDAAETTIVALSIFGGADIRVPRGVEVDLSGFAVFGGTNESGEEEAVHPGSPLVRIRAYALFGGTNVKHVH